MLVAISHEEARKILQVGVAYRKNVIKMFFQLTCPRTNQTINNPKNTECNVRFIRCN